MPLFFFYAAENDSKMWNLTALNFILHFFVFLCNTPFICTLHFARLTFSVKFDVFAVTSSLIFYYIEQDFPLVLVSNKQVSEDINTRSYNLCLFSDVTKKQLLHNSESMTSYQEVDLFTSVFRMETKRKILKHFHLLMLYYLTSPKDQKTCEKNLFSFYLHINFHFHHAFSM